MEHRVDMRGLAGLPWVVAKVPEGNSVVRGFPLRNVVSKPQNGLPSLQHQSQEKNLDNIQL